MQRSSVFRLGQYKPRICPAQPSSLEDLFERARPGLGGSLNLLGSLPVGLGGYEEGRGGVVA